jgi:hypothetical protein
MQAQKSKKYKAAGAIAACAGFAGVVAGGGNFWIVLTVVGFLVFIGARFFD